jgi:serine/threonine-protein kinase RsbW
VESDNGEVVATATYEAQEQGRGIGGSAVRLTIPAKPEYITLCRLALTGIARLRPLSAEVVADLKLALTEACSNSVRHAYADGAGVVEISFDLQPDRLVIEVSDDGAGFVPEGGRIHDDDDDLSEGGLGIAIIHALADEVEIARGAGGRGSTLRFVKLLAGASR